jgi:hypothetical protein
MLRIQLLSDLHLEAPKAYDVFEIIPSAPYLALIGDIGNVKHPEYFEFLTIQLTKFKTVFLLLGNHEPYGSTWAATKQKILEFEKEKREESGASVGGIGKFVFLDKTRFDLSNNITILGCTLYSKILPTQAERVSFGLNDFYDIKDWTVEDHNQAHISDLAWLNNQVKLLSKLEPDRRIIILTHHSPTLLDEASNPKNAGSPISSGFSSDLSGEVCWFSANVRVWAFGHTHFNCDFLEESGKRIVANQRGYYFSQSEGFDESKAIEL